MPVARTEAGIREVAQAAGVSVSTVSRVLNGKTGSVSISPATAERVRQAAAELQYQPNAWARSLRTSRANTIGVIAYDLTHPIAGALLEVISAASRPRGYHLLVGTAEHDSGEGWALSDILSAGRVDGVILIGDTLLHASAQQNRFVDGMNRLLRSHPSAVTIGSRPSTAGEWSIIVDNAAGVALALDHLVQLSHSRIAYVMDGFHPDSWEDQRRLQAYRDFQSTHGLPHDPTLEVVVGSLTLPGTQEAIARLLAMPRPPTALFVNNCVTAIMVLKAALLAGLHVPADLSIVGFDDVAFSTLCTPSITSVRQPLERMGDRAVRQLLGMIESTGDESSDGQLEKTVVFAPALVARESCAAPRVAP